MMVLAAVLGLVVGSFLNVCIHRLPLGESLAWPASRCPKCAVPLKPYDNIPVISYLLLGGRCRACKEPISLQYPIVEIVTASLFVGSYLWFESPLLFARIAFACALVVLFFVDLEHHRLPNEITLPGIVVGFACSLFLPPGWKDSLLGILIGGGSLWLLGWLWLMIRKEEGMGFGDVKMLAMIGAFIGWKAMIATLFFATILGSTIGVALIATRKGDLKTALPFGCFLAIGALIGASVGDRIIAWYLGFYL